MKLKANHSKPTFGAFVLPFLVGLALLPSAAQAQLAAGDTGATLKCSFPELSFVVEGSPGQLATAKFTFSDGSTETEKLGKLSRQLGPADCENFVALVHVKTIRFCRRQLDRKLEFHSNFSSQMLDALERASESGTEAQGLPDRMLVLRRYAEIRNARDSQAIFEEHYFNAGKRNLSQPGLAKCSQIAEELKLHHRYTPGWNEAMSRLGYIGQGFEPSRANSDQRDKSVREWFDAAPTNEQSSAGAH